MLEWIYGVGILSVVLLSSSPQSLDSIFRSAVKSSGWFAEASGNVIRHHPPDEAGKFPGNRDFCNVGWLLVIQHEMDILSAQPFTAPVGISNYFRTIPFLTLSQQNRLLSDGTSVIGGSGFRQQPS